ncbi:MAG: YvcK family protein, partial [Chlamydiia bacterium]|nr:YvcK family protein [Chlamydiia bacterium]
MKKVVVMGGGTGNFTVLRGLKKHHVDLSAIVSMADDGGSTGILRDELGVLPPGDVRQCLVALSDSSRMMRSLMNYRFENGGLGGHSLGNLILSALEKVTGSFERAVEEMGRILY